MADTNEPVQAPEPTKEPNAFILSDLIPPEPVPEPVESPPPEPTAPKHPEWLVEEASDLGISPAEIERYPTEQLGTLVRHLSRQERAYRTNATSAPVQASPPPVATEPEEVFDLDIPDELADTVAEPVIKLLKDVHGKMAKRVKAAEEAAAKVQKAHEARELREFVREVDSVLDNLGNPALGKSGGYAQGSAEALLREAVFKLAHANPNDQRPLAQRLTDANKAIFKTAPSPAGAAPAAPAPVDPELAKRQAAWANGGVAKPTHRQPPPAKSAEAAKQFLAEGLRALADKEHDVTEKFA